MRFFLSLGYGVCLFAVSGCSAIRTREAVAAAEVEFDAATTARAERLAPYSWAKAKAFLDEAKIQEGRARAEWAQRYAQQAERLAVLAKADALAASKPAPPKDAPSANPNAAPERP